LIHALQEGFGADLSRAAREQGAKISVPRVPSLQRHAVSILTNRFWRIPTF
jgi:hypothetical protein